ncbi:hypothetical protein SNEBB_003412 [Seison nebaliae]|nr:hypothetical protein SNEBB_003412 [Seison nebaliae]
MNEKKDILFTQKCQEDKNDEKYYGKLPYVLSTKNPIIYQSVNTLNHVHDYLKSVNDNKWSWTSTIVGTTILTRLVFIAPLNIYCNRLMIRLLQSNMDVSIKVQRLSKHLTSEVRRKLLKNEKISENISLKEKEKLIKRNLSKKVKQWQNDARQQHQAFPSQLIVATLLQMPVWLLISSSIRCLCEVDGKFFRADLSEDGCLWFKNLLKSDQTGAISILLIIINLINIEFSNATKSMKYHLNENQVLTTDTSKMKTSTTSRVLLFVRQTAIRLTSIAIGVIGGFIPTAISSYWLFNSSLTLLQNYAMEKDKIRKLFNLPPIKLTDDMTRTHRPFLDRFLLYRNRWKNIYIFLKFLRR